MSIALTSLIMALRIFWTMLTGRLDDWVQDHDQYVLQLCIHFEPFSYDAVGILAGPSHDREALESLQRQVVLHDRVKYPPSERTKQWTEVERPRYRIERVA